MKKFLAIFKHNIVTFGKIDFLLIFIVTLIYGSLSFYRLGDLKGPNTFCRLDRSEEIIFDFDQEENIVRMKFFNGEKNSKFRVYISSDNKEYEFLQNVEADGVFTWNDIRIAKKGRYIKFVMQDDSSLGEVGFYQNNKKLLSYSTRNANLSDESDLIPNKISYMNSTYFDEVYFARTAYEMVNGLPQYEWTHPPLGKIIQAIPLYITHSFSPFLYRFMGNVAGILLVIVMYFFGGILFRKRGIALLSSVVMALDTFHFAHTRMGTVDSHLVLFIVLAALFMVLYVQKDKNRYLFLSGIFFGLSICVKWTGFYGGLALAIIYFFHFFRMKKNLLSTVVKGSIFFVVIPLMMYCSVYLLFPNNLHHTDNLDSIVEEQKSMYQYHSTLNAEHYFSSSWYTWPISYKPVWYHEQIYSNDKKESISGVGNLVLWIGGILGVIYCMCKMIFKKDKESFYLIVLILSLWLPYAMINRIMFLYHYFPVLPFLFLALVSLLKDLSYRMRLKLVVPIFLFCALLFFLAYYPVVSGTTISNSYADILELFDSWYF